MNLMSRSGGALVALAASALFALPAASADLGGRGSSMRDGYEAPSSAGGPCYLRSDVGYSFSSSPSISWGNAQTASSENIDDNWFTETGLGCGSGARGFRAEVMFGFRGESDVTSYVSPLNDTLNTTLTSYTMMFNAYYDLGTFNRLTPYIGAGIGAAYHIVDDAYFTTNPAVRQFGDRDLAFAWSLMAGFGYRVTDRTILDIGYRYIDLGKATTERHDTAGFVNPRVVIDDIAAHEFRVGLRWHFGSGASESLK